jgi:hypothetical protein
VISLLFLAALAASEALMPSADPAKICDSARVAAAADDQKTAYSACIRDERAARDQLQKNWNKYTPDARSTCAEPQSVSPSYVEVLTCLEMQSGANFGPGDTTSSKSTSREPLTKPK